MPDRNNISNELSIISQTVANIPFLPVFTVPENYFAEFPGKLMEKIREDANYETQLLSPVLGGMEKKNPFSVPEGYFAGFGNQLKPMALPVETVEPAPVVETVEVAPLVELFETTPVNESGKSTPVIRMFGLKKVWKLSVAAMLAGMIGISAYLYFQPDITVMPTTQVNIVDELPKVSEDDMNDFLLSVPDMPQAETPSMAGLDNFNIEDMLKDVQDSELQDYVRATPEQQPEKLN